MHEFKKTIRDDFGDDVIVSVPDLLVDLRLDRRVDLRVADTSLPGAPAEALANLSPKRARKLAKALRRAADVAEGKEREAEPEKEATYKVGDRVRIVSSPYLGDLPDGPVSGGAGEIVDVGVPAAVGRGPVRVKFRDGQRLTFKESELALAPAPRTVADFPVGSYAGVIVDGPTAATENEPRGPHHLGEIVRVADASPFSRSVLTERLGGKTTPRGRGRWSIDPAQLEPLKLTPCKAIVPCLGETADGEHLMSDGFLL